MPSGLATLAGPAEVGERAFGLAGDGEGGGGRKGDSGGGRGGCYLEETATRDHLPDAITA
ncbi:hypothetical protein GCM10020219_039670 [Nonomuraea dietziae]